MGYKHLKFPKNSLFLVTGGAGFIGSNLCEAILSLGYRVRCLDNLSTGNRSNVDMFINNKNYEFIEGDIKDLDVCIKTIMQRILSSPFLVTLFCECIRRKQISLVTFSFRQSW